MGRVSNINKAQLVDYDNKTDLARCLLCDKTLKGNLLGNIKRHYVTIHKFNFDSDVFEAQKNETNLATEDSRRNNSSFLSTRLNYHEKLAKSTSDAVIRSNQDVSIKNTPDISLRKTQQMRKNPDPTIIYADRKRKVFENKEFEDPVGDAPVSAARKESRDHSDVFGEHVAAKHRKYSNHVKSVVEHLISEILFEADMGKHNDPTRQILRGTSSSGAVALSYNPFAETDSQHQSNLLQSLKVSRSSSTSSDSENLEAHMY